MFDMVFLGEAASVTSISLHSAVFHSSPGPRSQAMNQYKIYSLVAISCMGLVLANSNGQNVARDPREPDLRRVGARLPTLDAEFKAAILNGDLSRVGALQAELGILLSTAAMTVEQHRRIADMVIENKLAGMLPVLARNLNRRIWIGSSMRAYTTQYPLTRAIVAFGRRSLDPVKEQLLKSKEWYEVEVLAYCLLGIQGAEEAGKSLQALQRQASDKELRDLLQRAEDWIIRHGELYMGHFAEDRIPRIPEDEMLFVELPERANAKVDESSPARTPSDKSGVDDRVEMSDQKEALADRERDSVIQWVVVSGMLIVVSCLIWLFLMKRGQ